MTPWDIPVILNNAASRAGQVVCLAFVPIAGLWFCVCKLGMV
jgi:hypothetical protein